MKKLLCLKNILCHIFFYVAIFASGETHQIYVPNPVVHLSFDYQRNPGYDNIRGVSGSLLGSYETTIDRFGKSNRAIRFNGIGSAIRFENINVSSINTISFWVFISDPATIPTGSVPYNKNELTRNFYNWTDKDNKVLRGLARKKATVGFNRYITKDDGTRVPWYLWSYAPAQFDQSGWYHIFVIQGAYYTRLIMYKPSGKKVYSYNWLGAQSFSEKKYLYIGGLPAEYGFGNNFDDFKIYNGDLSDDVVDALHVREYPIGRQFRLVNNYSGNYAVIKGASMEEHAEIIQYDSHSGNGVWSLQVAGGSNEYRILSVHSNKYLVVEDASLASGAKIIQHNAPTTNSVWILEKVDESKHVFQLRNKNSGKYLSIGSDINEIGACLIQGEGYNSYSNWYFEPSTPIMENLPIDNGLYRLKNKNSGKYLDINLGENGNSKILQHEGSPIKYSDIWNITKSSKNSFFIQNIVDDNYIVGPDNYDDYANITEGDNVAENNRDLWQLIPTDVEGEYKIRNLHNYKYMVVKDASQLNGAEVIQYATAENNNSTWKLEKYFYSDSPLHHGWYSFTNLNSYKLMVVKDASTSNFGELIQHSTGERNSVFELFENKWGTVTIENINSGKYVVVRDASLNENAPIIQYENEPGPNGLWVVSRSYMPSGAGYEFRNLRSGLVLTVENASLNDYARLVQKETELEEGTWIASIVPQPRSQINTLSSFSKLDMENGLLVNVSYPNDNISVSYDTNMENVTVQVNIFDITGKNVYSEGTPLYANNATFTGFSSNVYRNTLYIIEILVSDGTKHIEKVIFK